MYVSARVCNFVTSLPVNKGKLFETTPSDECFCFNHRALISR